MGNGWLNGRFEEGPASDYSALPRIARHMREAEEARRSRASQSATVSYYDWTTDCRICGATLRTTATTAACTQCKSVFFRDSPGDAFYFRAPCAKCGFHLSRPATEQHVNALDNARNGHAFKMRIKCSGCGTENDVEIDRVQGAKISKVPMSLLERLAWGTAAAAAGTVVGLYALGASIEKKEKAKEL